MEHMKPSFEDIGTEMVNEFEAPTPHPDTAMIHGDRMKTLRFLIGLEKAEMLDLRYLHDYSYAEIAAIQNCPIGTVRSRINRACRAARLALVG